MTIGNSNGRMRMQTIGIAWLSIAAALALVGCAGGADEGSESAALGGAYLVMSRPANVPANYVVTPNGYFHPDCVQEVSDEEIVRTEEAVGRIERIDGTAAREIPACAHRRYDVRGELVVEGEAAATSSGPDARKPTISGWVESANSTAIGPASYLHAQWNIPPAPASHAGQTIYFFPGLETASSSSTTILQPVLGWNAGGGIAGWSLASWNCCKSGTTQHSGFIPAPGSTVSGDIGGTSCTNGVCSHWQVVSYDWSSQRSTTLNTSAFGLQMNWLFGGVLEAYGVSACNELPSSTVTFSAFYVNNANGTHVATPAWRHDVGSPSPSCGYNITQSGSNVILHY
jgi:hypothetical protein